MACHIVYGRPYCNDAKEGVGGITPPKLNRGGWNSARTKYFEGKVVCKNLGAIGSGAAEGIWLGNRHLIAWSTNCTGSIDKSRQQPSQPVRSMCQQLDEVDRRGPPPLSEFPFIQQTHATVQSADQPTTRCNLDWGTPASTPYAHNNRFGSLASIT